MLFFVYFATFAVFSVIFTREVIAPASMATCDKRWRIYAGALNAGNLVVVMAAGLSFQTWIDHASLFHLRNRLDPVSASLIAFMASSFVAYWYHRATHWSDTLWRTVHQLHSQPGAH